MGEEVDAAFWVTPELFPSIGYSGVLRGCDIAITRGSWPRWYFPSPDTTWLCRNGKITHVQVHTGHWAGMWRKYGAPGTKMPAVPPTWRWRLANEIGEVLHVDK